LSRRSCNGCQIFLTIMLICVAVLTPTNGVAHPHVWAIVRSEILFGPDNKITGVRHACFDEFYTAMAIQGLDTNEDGVYSREELEPLAKVNVESLKEFGYFTFVRVTGDDKFLPLKPPVDYSLDYNDPVITLHFTLPLETPIDPGTKGVTIEVYDPSFFVAFGFARKSRSRSPDLQPGARRSSTLRIRKARKRPKP
jgi:ABC-type uncharacterized transport system substrate-binding protein